MSKGQKGKKTIEDVMREAQAEPQKPVKVETWEHKRVVVARDNKGRFVARKRYTKDTDIGKLKSRFKKYRSFSPKIRRKRLGAGADHNLVEVADYTYNPTFDPHGSMYYVKLKIKGKVIEARSSMFYSRANIQDAREEAYENAFLIAGAVLNPKIYDKEQNEAFANKAIQEFADKGSVLEQGIIRYTNRQAETT